MNIIDCIAVLVACFVLLAVPFSLDGLRDDTGQIPATSKVAVLIVALGQAMLILYAVGVFK